MCKTCRGTTHREALVRPKKFRMYLVEYEDGYPVPTKVIDIWEITQPEPINSINQFYKEAKKA